jgi:hypothetical protein
MAALACSLPAEHGIVADFFAASRLRDLTALSKFADTVFEPLQQGIVTDFAITAVTPPRADGEFLLKEVTITAPLRTPDGGTVDATIVLVLKRPAALTERQPFYDGWRVVAVRE